MITCNDCKFGFKPEGASEVEVCRRHPPQIHMAHTPRGPVNVGIWPPTQGKNWCGEGKLAPTIDVDFTDKSQGDG